MDSTKPQTSAASTPRAQEKTGGFDANERAVIHRAFRREIRLLAELIAGVKPGDTARARVLVGHFADIRQGVQNHYEGENKLLWPPIRARIAPNTEVIDRMIAQNERIASTLARADGLVKTWANSVSEADRNAAVAALRDHYAVLVEHLDSVEADLLPLAERYMTAKEWKALGDYFVTSTPKSKLLKFFGMVMEDAGPSEQAVLLKGLPAPARPVWLFIGRPQYARTVRTIRLTP